MAVLGSDGIAGKDDLQRPAFADKAGQALRAAIAWDDAKLDFGLAEFGVGGGNADVARHGELEPAAEGIAVDGGDDGFGQVFDLREDLLAAQSPGAAFESGEFSEVVDIGAGDKGFFLPRR